MFTAITPRIEMRKGIKYLEMVCSCGAKKMVQPSHLATGTKSCGCHQSERMTERNLKHGLSQSRIYKVWDGMMQRCYRASHAHYANYGGRGIQVCPEWQTIEGFHAWAIKNGYADHLEIDRLDNSKGYEPNNARFATRKENANNRGTCVKVRAFGVVKSLADWAEDRRCRVLYATLRKRIQTLGWSAEMAIATPPIR